MITQQIEANQAGRDFVVGDLHGCLDELAEAMTARRFDPRFDRIFSVGDLIDRGPHSLEVLKLIEEPWFFAVRGNHEDMMLATFLPAAAALPDSASMWFPNGGGWAADAWPILRGSRLVERVAELPFAMVVKKRDGSRVNIVHAEFQLGATDDQVDAGFFDRARVMWGRQRLKAGEQPDPGLSRTFVGHTPVKEQKYLGSYAFIDTGVCFAKGRLTVLEI